MLAGVALRYPEKTFYLGQVFRDTTTSYKFLWFLSLLSLIRRTNDCSLRSADILTEMATIAWHPVCLYRLSFGRQDTLQDMILELKRKSGLAADSAPEVIRKFVEGSGEIRASLEYFKRHVPTRFLVPWFAEKLRGVQDHRRDRLIEELAKQSQQTPFVSPYWFDGGAIRLNDSWRAFLVENMAIVQAFGEHQLAHYLQARNPNVPGILNKMRAPTERQLTPAREFWRYVRAHFEHSRKLERFRDIYFGQPLGESFAIDHFLPWSFVVHDLLWNLTPVETTTNSKKGDVLPDLVIYLPWLAKLHFEALDVAKKRPKFIEDHSDCFKEDVESLLALGEDRFLTRYREVIVPQAQIAINQGFQSGWKLRN